MPYLLPDFVINLAVQRMYISGKQVVHSSLPSSFDLT